MTSSELRERILEEIDTYDHAEPEGTLGQPWTLEKVQGHIRQLTDALVEPEVVSFICRDTYEQMRAEPPVVRNYWLIARTDKGDIVFFDESADEFGLAKGDAFASPETIGVRGDLIGVFCAR